VTFEGSDQFPDWSGDGQHVVYNTLRGGTRRLLEAGRWWVIGAVGRTVPASSIYEAILTHDGKRVIYREGGIPGDLYFVHRDSLSDAPAADVAVRRTLAGDLPR
jgi:hypothetical protein